MHVRYSYILKNKSKGRESAMSSVAYEKGTFFIRVPAIERKGNKEEGVRLFLDFGRKLSGRLTLKIQHFSASVYQKKQNLILEYKFGPRIDFMHFKSCLRLIEDMEDYTYMDASICSMQYASVEVPQTWGEEGNDWILEEAALLLEMRNVKQYGRFECCDPLLNEIWKAGIDTVHLCMYPHKHAYAYKHLLSEERRNFLRDWSGYASDYVLVDGPRRDREVWVGDLLPEVRTCWFAFREQEVIKNSLKVIIDQQHTDGFLPASSVSCQRFSEYCCWFVIVLFEYILLSGDMTFLGEIKDNYRRVMEWICRQTDDSRMMKLDIRQTWAWTLTRKGYVVSSQCVLYKAYLCAAKLEYWLGCSLEGKRYTRAAQQLKRILQDYAWDSSKGAFRDEADQSCKRVSLDANAYAVLFGIAEKDQSERVFTYLERNMWTPYGTRLLHPPEEDNGCNWPHNLHIWPFSVCFKVEARLMQGETESALDLVRRCWGTMVREGSGTFWEIIDSQTGKFMDRRIHEPGFNIDTWNSYSHGWSAGVSHLLQAYVAGIRPIAPGFREFVIDPQPGSLTRIAAAIPTPDSVIEIKMFKNLDNGTYSGIIVIPEGTSGIWDYNSTGVDVVIHGKEKDDTGRYLLGKGIHQFLMKPVKQ